jgi:hypothetical protein
VAVVDRRDGGGSSVMGSGEGESVSQGRGTGVISRLRDRTGGTV